jgi:hypothetical protein
VTALRVLDGALVKRDLDVRVQDRTERQV